MSDRGVSVRPSGSNQRAPDVRENPENPEKRPPKPNETEITMLIDCNTCPGRRVACDDCMMTVFLGPVGVPNSANDEVRCDEFVIDHQARIDDAIAVFHAAGMIGKSDRHGQDVAVNAGNRVFVPGSGGHLRAG